MLLMTMHAHMAPHKHTGPLFGALLPAEDGWSSVAGAGCSGTAAVEWVEDNFCSAKTQSGGRVLVC